MTPEEKENYEILKESVQDTTIPLLSMINDKLHEIAFGGMNGELQQTLIRTHLKACSWILQNINEELECLSDLCVANEIPVAEQDKMQ